MRPLPHRYVWQLVALHEITASANEPASGKASKSRGAVAEACAAFGWLDAFQPANKCTAAAFPSALSHQRSANTNLALCLAGAPPAPSPPSVVAEAAAVLFNVGAHYAQVATTLDLSTLDGLRLAATYFQVSSRTADLSGGVNASSRGRHTRHFACGRGATARGGRVCVPVPKAGADIDGAAAHRRRPGRRRAAVPGAAYASAGGRVFLPADRAGCAADRQRLASRALQWLTSARAESLASPIRP